MRNMKYSGIEWIGDIPEDWEVNKLGRYFSERNVKVSDIDYKPLSVTKLGILPQLDGVAKTDNHDDSRKLVLPNDFVINSRSDRKQSCGISNYKGSVSLINIVLENHYFNTRYLNFLLKNYGFAEEFYRWGTGIVADLWSTKYTRMKKIMLPIPSLLDQQCIADYLDEKCKKIDSAIEKTKATIGEYKKLKQSIITETVTKGLNPNVELKDSKSEWIGSIPKHWHIGNGFRLCDVIRGNCSFKKDDLKSEGDFIAIQYGKTYKVDEIDYSYNYYVDKTFFKENQIVKHKNIILVTTSETVEDLGHSCFYNLETTALLGGEQMCFNPKNEILASKFFYYISRGFSIDLKRYAVGLKVFRVKNTDIKKINITLPPIQEQQEIAEYLDKKCVEIDNLITKKQQTITELDSYKKSIIYECVTGKVEIATSKDAVAEDNIYPFFPSVISTDKKRFAQAVLACKILDVLGKNDSRVILEKILFTTETHIGFDFGTNYQRQVAGPLDVSLYEAEAIIKRNKWFDVKKVRKHTEYRKNVNTDKYLKYYNDYYAQYDSEINRIIDIFKDLSVDEAEKIATVYAVWNDFIIDKKTINNEDIIADILNNWNDSKQRFSNEEWQATLEQMSILNIIPKGYCKHTTKQVAK